MTSAPEETRPGISGPRPLGSRARPQPRPSAAIPDMAPAPPAPALAPALFGDDPVRVVPAVVPKQQQPVVAESPSPGICPRVKQLLHKLHRRVRPNPPVPIAHRAPQIRPPPLELMREGIPKDEYALVGQSLEGVSVWAYHSNAVTPSRLLAVKYYLDSVYYASAITAEVRALTKIKKSPHPRLLSFVEDEGFVSVRTLRVERQIAIITEYYPCTLSALCGVCPPEALGNVLYATVASEITSGLIHLHRLGIVHCDIKPENILIDKTGHCIIADYNIAFHHDPSNWNSQCVEIGGVLRGTPCYAAWEMRRSFDAQPSAHVFDFRADYWSLGVLLFALVTDFNEFLLRDWKYQLPTVLRPTLAEPIPMEEDPALNGRHTMAYVLKMFTICPLEIADLIMALCEIDPDVRLNDQALLDRLNDRGAGGASGSEPPFIIEKHLQSSVARWNHEFQLTGKPDAPAQAQSESPQFDITANQPELVPIMLSPPTVTPPDTPAAKQRRVLEQLLVSKEPHRGRSGSGSGSGSPSPSRRPAVDLNPAGQLTPGPSPYTRDIQIPDDHADSASISKRELPVKGESQAVVDLKLVRIDIPSESETLQVADSDRHPPDAPRTRKTLKRSRRVQLPYLIVMNPNPDSDPDTGSDSISPSTSSPSSWTASNSTDDDGDSMAAFAPAHWHKPGDLLFRVRPPTTPSPNQDLETSPLLATANTFLSADTYHSALNAHKVRTGRDHWEPVRLEAQQQPPAGPGTRTGFTYFSNPFVNPEGSQRVVAVA
ncbi:kinase-like domain-containing protein [Mycena amicta]|nr:kinase-like domain-containing protein [Mycena amicta]